VVTFNLQQPYGTLKLYDCMVEVKLQDSLTCADIGEFKVDPITILNILHYTERYAIDGTLCEEIGDFRPALFDACNAWFHHRCVNAAPQAERARLTCTMDDAIGFLLDAKKEGSFDLEVQGAPWRVVV
jgi:hypothetical protein